MSAIISVENLSKCYRIQHQRQRPRYHSLRETVSDKFSQALRNIWHRNGKGAAGTSDTDETFWALKDVSFEVNQGDVVGIIGRNGAGKSTLLKILSRITEPTKGCVRLRGRVASLLEVGTGFHPELTGRENIFLNGAILGMTRAEIRRKFDEIVAFAEVERFLDTPVKRYSSGMYVRLAFAVAAHLEPEILIVDEVLAVGDAEFQKKCLGKMQSVATTEGRTVLFVSHNMGAVQTLCSKAVLLQAGSIKMAGAVVEIVRDYLADGLRPNGNELGRVVKVGSQLELFDFKVAPGSVRSGNSLSFSLRLRALSPCRLSEMALLFYSTQGSRIAIADVRGFGFPLTLQPEVSCKVEGTIKSFPLVEGEYSAGVYIHGGDFCGNLLDLVSVGVEPKVDAHGHTPFPAVHRGVVELDFSGTANATVA